MMQNDTPDLSTRARTSVPLRGRRLLLARAAWALVTGLSIILVSIVALGLYRGLTASPLTFFAKLSGMPSVLMRYLLEEVGWSVGAFMGFQIAIFWIPTVVFIATGLFIFWRKSSEWMPILGSLYLISFGTNYAILSDLPLIYPDLTWLLILPEAIGWVIFTAFYFFFPNGRMVPARRDLFVIITLLLIAGGYYFEGDNNATYAFFHTSWGVAVALQSYRYIRVASPVERQQAKWLAYGVGAVVTVSIVLFVSRIIFPRLNNLNSTGFYFNMTAALLQNASYLLIIVAIGLAILRYRLWDIDVLINRTLVYGALTGTLALIYFGGIVLLQRLLPAETQLAIVASTLGIAALFNPLRRRIQNTIDRRFYRRKYDAQQVLAAFAETARDETDLDRLSDELVRVVEETMQPAHVSLWLKPVANRDRPQP